MVDFPIKTSIYKGFSMAMLNNQRVESHLNPLAAPTSRPISWASRRAGFRPEAELGVPPGGFNVLNVTIWLFNIAMENPL